MCLIRMYLYKLRHSAGIWICLLLNILLYVIPGLFRLIFPELFGLLGNYSATDTLFRTVSGGLPCMICAIYSAVFFHDDEKHGFVKNIYPQLMHKMALFYARMTVSLVMLLTMYLSGFLSAILFSVLLHGTISGSAGTTLGLLLSFLLSAAFLSLVLLLELQTRGTVLPIVLSVVSMSGMISLLCTLLNYLMDQILKSAPPDLNNFILSGQPRNLSLNTMDGNTTAVITAVAVSAVYFSISVIWSSLLLHHKDVR